MCILVTRAPTSHLTTPALEELDNLTSLFDFASSSCQSASDLLVRHCSLSFPAISNVTLQSSIQNLHREAHKVIGPSLTRYYHHNDDNTLTPAELDRLNGKTYLFAEDHSLLSSSSIALPISRATSVTISDTETHPPTFYTTDKLHPALAQDLEEFRIHSSATPISPMTFHDLNHPTSDRSSPPQIARHTPPEVPKLFLQPIQSRIDPHMHFFHQPYHVEPLIESRRMMTYGSSFGGGFGGNFGPIPTIVLDPAWHSLAEQLGF